MLQAVIQEEKTGCGIAACAALAGVTYTEARSRANAMGIYAADKSLWSKTEHVRRLLAHYGIQAAAEETPFNSWDALPDKALLAIKWHQENGQPFWHWVVFIRHDGQAWVLDSKKALKNHQRQDFGRIKPKWFIAING